MQTIHNKMWNSLYPSSLPGEKSWWQERLEVVPEVPQSPTLNWMVRPCTDPVMLYIFSIEVHINNFVRNLFGRQKQGKEAYHLLTITLKKRGCVNVCFFDKSSSQVYTHISISSSCRFQNKNVQSKCTSILCHKKPYHSVVNKDHSEFVFLRNS